MGHFFVGLVSVFSFETRPGPHSPHVFWFSLALSVRLPVAVAHAPRTSVTAAGLPNLAMMWRPALTQASFSRCLSGLRTPTTPSSWTRSTVIRPSGSRCLTTRPRSRRALSNAWLFIARFVAAVSCYSCLCHVVLYDFLVIFQIFSFCSCLFSFFFGTYMHAGV
jgi:hypothetical protein